MYSLIYLLHNSHKVLKDMQANWESNWYFLCAITITVESRENCTLTVVLLVVKLSDRKTKNEIL